MRMRKLYRDFKQQLRMQAKQLFSRSRRLRPVHTKHDNYNDNDKYMVLKIVLNIKE